MNWAHGFFEKIYQNALIAFLNEEGINIENEKEFDEVFSKKKVGKSNVI